MKNFSPEAFGSYCFFCGVICIVYTFLYLNLGARYVAYICFSEIILFFSSFLMSYKKMNPKIVGYMFLVVGWGSFTIPAFLMMLGIPMP
jgi:hypothetical protein